MKVILEFDSIEEKEELYYAQKGAAYASLIEELDQMLRSTVKYGTPLLSGKEKASALEIKIADEIRSKIYEALDDRDLKIYE